MTKAFNIKLNITTFRGVHTIFKTLYILFLYRLDNAEACFILTCRSKADRNAAVRILEVQKVK